MVIFAVPSATISKIYIDFIFSFSQPSIFLYFMTHKTNRAYMKGNSCDRGWRKEESAQRSLLTCDSVRKKKYMVSSTQSTYMDGQIGTNVLYAAYSYVSPFGDT